MTLLIKNGRIVDPANGRDFCAVPETLFLFCEDLRARGLEEEVRRRTGLVIDAYFSGTKVRFILDAVSGAQQRAERGELAFGTNYAIKRYTKNTLFDEKIGGTFHAAVGSGYPETGSKNSSGLHWDMICDLRTGGVAEADGERISESGNFAKSDWPGI